MSLQAFYGRSTRGNNIVSCFLNVCATRDNLNRHQINCFHTEIFL
jgi:hypothetical protein